jgi:ATP-dependent DNA helicase RecQ
MSGKRAQSHPAKEAAAVAKKCFGFEQLRPGQEQAIESLASKRDTLVVMPTGYGKSAIYQIAGMMVDGVVLVISPLIALQKDQVDSINANGGNAEARVINSALSGVEFRESLDRLRNQCCKFVFLAPEQLPKAETSEALQAAGISMLVIDEAHCISEWGHDFRPDYLQLGNQAEMLGRPVILAMTATASARVREEIVNHLG